MSFNHVTTIVAASILLISTHAFAVPPASPAATQPTEQLRLPTPADLKEMHDAGEYRTCLQQIARILALSPDVTKNYDRFAMLLLRGDCLLHLGDRETAYDAYTAAAKSPEPALAAEGRATALLIQRSAGLLFMPKSPRDAAAIDIVDHQKRNAAMLVLKDQEQSDRKAVIDAALDAKTLVPIIDAVPTFLDLHGLELTATGSDKQIHPTLVAVGEHARELMSAELETIDDRIKTIEHVANRKVVLGGGWWWGYLTRQGLTTDDRTALRSDIEYVDKINSASNQFQHLSHMLGGTGEKWNPLIEQGMKVAQHGHDVLAAE